MAQSKQFEAKTHEWAMIRYVCTAYSDGELIHKDRQEHKLEEPYRYQDYLSNLKDETTWKNYKEEIRYQIEKTKKELQQLEQKFNQPNQDHQNLKEYKEALSEQLSQLHLHAKNINKIDKFISDPKEYNHRINLFAKYEFENFLKKKGIVDFKDHQDNYLNDPEILKYLMDLIRGADSLKRPEDPSGLDEHTELTQEFILGAVEFHFESAATSAELHEAVHAVHEVEAAQSATAATTSANTGMQIFRNLPIVANFVLGLSYLREAYEAYQDETTPQRKTKIATGIFAGSIFLGSGIVGAMLTAGVGLLATSAAIFATPIVLGAAAIAVYTAVLYRDIYTLTQENEKLRRATLDKNSIDKEILDKENQIVTEYLKNKSNDKSCVDLLEQKNQIDTLRKYLSKNEDPRVKADYIAIKQEYEKKLNNHPGLIKSLKTDPTLLRLKLQQSDTEEKVNKLTQSVKLQRIKVIQSVLCVAAVTIALGAIFAAPPVALGLLATAGVIFAVSSLKNMYDTWKEKKKAKAERNMQAEVDKPLDEGLDKGLKATTGLHVAKKLAHASGHELQLADIIHSQHHASSEEEKVEEKTPILTTRALVEHPDSEMVADTSLDAQRKRPRHH